MASEKIFEVGQIVRLKSGGPEMTVEYNNKYKNEYGETYRYSYECQWFAGRKLEHGTFPHDSLELVKPNDE